MRPTHARALRYLVAVVLCGAGASAAPNATPVLHEPIAPNPSEDLAMHVVLDGDLPAALMTAAGPVSGPDPRNLPSREDTTYDSRTEQDEFRPDRDPQGGGGEYNDPFIPSTAPFTRIAAFDAVRSNYDLYVRNPSLTAMTPGAGAQLDDDAFYMDAVVDLSPGRRVRIPSVGPGARIVKGHMGVGAQNVSYVVSRDGADNWYVEGIAPRGHVRARLVLEVAIPRATFGGPMADVAWSEMMPAPSLPVNVAREATQVCAAIGVSRRMRPCEAVAKLVEYFRGFAESDQPVPHRGSVYLDLALSKKGVCRHRAFAFMVTALQLGIPTRLAQSDVHAWVEVHDGSRWRTIDLGGAGRLTSRTNAQPDRPAYPGPADSFPWPQGAQGGRDALEGSSKRAAGSGAGDAAPAPSSAAIVPQPDRNLKPSPAPADWEATESRSGSPENRPPSNLSLTVSDDGVRRGLPLRAHGEVRANGQPCPGLGVELLLRNPRTQLLTFLGSLATGNDGTFAGAVVVPASAPVGNYEVIARTAGNTRCGSGQN